MGGSVRVQYKQQRGSHMPGDEITDPEEFFTEVLDHYFDDYKELYDALPSDQ